MRDVMPIARAAGRMAGSAVAAVILVGAAAGCSSSGEQVVFALNQEAVHGPVHTAEIFDIVVRFGNITDQRVHLRSISLMPAVKNVRPMRASVYNARRVGFFPAEELGDLPTECPAKFVPSPVHSLTVKPHGNSYWFGVLPIRIVKPGRYEIKRVLIDYSTPAGDGWQYQTVDVTLTVHNPPLPGPLPSRQIC